MELLKLISFYKNRSKSALTVTLKCLNEIKNFNHLNNSVLHINKDAIDQAKKLMNTFLELINYLENFMAYLFLLKEISVPMIKCQHLVVQFF